jgi:hypothetical protein
MECVSEVVELLARKMATPSGTGAPWRVHRVLRSRLALTALRMTHHEGLEDRAYSHDLKLG